MNYNNVVFETSFGKASQLTQSDLVEIAFAGRSNVGKSSLINKIFNRRNLARVSAVPGKTATINFFRLENVRFADLPGYGYAKVAQAEKQRWSDLIETYFNSDRRIELVFQLIDMRHPPTKDDLMMVDFLIQNEFPFVIVLTKKDKLSKKQQEERMAALMQEIPFADQIHMIPFSAVKGDGVEQPACHHRRDCAGRCRTGKGRAMQINDYGKLCTMMYEQLHPTADPQELAFYLSYAKPGEQMLELLCGSGRFLIPFWKKGLSIDGVDLSAQMLEQLEQKLPEAKPALHCCSADEYQSEKRYDYIFITCNSFSLFTDKELAKRVLKNAKRLLSEQGVFVFAVDTVSSVEPGDGELSQTVDQPLEDGKLLRMRMGARYDAAGTGAVLPQRL